MGALAGITSCHSVPVSPAVRKLVFSIGSILAVTESMNRLLWIFGAVFAAQAGMATMLTDRPTNSQLGTVFSMDFIEVGICVQSLVAESEATHEEFIFAPKNDGAPLTHTWILAQRGTEFNLFLGVRESSIETEIRNSYDIKNIVCITLLSFRDTLPTLSECSAKSESTLVLNETTSNFGISHLAIQHTGR